MTLLHKPKYTKEMRERAKQDGKQLVTVDVPGLCFQGLVDQAIVTKLLRFVNNEIFKKGKA